EGPRAWPANGITEPEGSNPATQTFIRKTPTNRVRCNMATPKAWWWVGAAKAMPGRGRSRGLRPQAGLAGRRRGRLLHLEELEPRLVLNGSITYKAPPTGSNLTLRVAKVSGMTDLQLFDNAQKQVIQQVVLNQPVQVQITGAAKASDLLTVDLSY